MRPIFPVINAGGTNCSGRSKYIMKIIRKYFWYVPAVIWMVIIFNMSGQTGEISSGLSLQVTEKVVDIIEIVRGGDETDAAVLTEKIHPYIRKCAHMTEYGILYILMFLSFLASAIATRSMAMSAIFSFVYACTDEFHQTFIAARAGQFTDVCIDMTGVLAANVLVLLVYSSWQIRKNKET